MPLKILDYNSDQYKKMVELRNEILRKPLGLTFNQGELENDKNDILLGAFEDDQILACCILTKIGLDTCQLRQMAVLPKMQKSGIGASLIDFAEHVARDSGFRNIIMHARKTAVGFYEKQGYSLDGEEFEEVTIPHYQMKKFLL